MRVKCALSECNEVNIYLCTVSFEGSVHVRYSRLKSHHLFIVPVHASTDWGLSETENVFHRDLSRALRSAHWAVLWVIAGEFKVKQSYLTKMERQIESQVPKYSIKNGNLIQLSFGHRLLETTDFRHNKPHRLNWSLIRHLGIGIRSTTLTSATGDVNQSRIADHCSTH